MLRPRRNLDRADAWGRQVEAVQDATLKESDSSLSTFDNFDRSTSGSLTVASAQVAELFGRGVAFATIPNVTRSITVPNGSTAFNVAAVSGSFQVPVPDGKNRRYVAVMSMDPYNSRAANLDLLFGSAVEVLANGSSFRSGGNAPIPTSVPNGWLDSIRLVATGIASGGVATISVSVRGTASNFSGASRTATVGLSGIQAFVSFAGVA